jgi:anti-anti-sigma factor
MLAAAPGCEFEVQRGPDWLLVRITSVDVDPADGLSLADQLWEVMERHFIYRMVLEMDQVPVLNSYLIGQLVSLRRRVEEHHGVIRLCGLSPYNHRVLQTTRLDNLFLPYCTRQEAVLGCSRPRQPR